MAGVSLCGDDMMRTLLYEAAQVMMTRVQKWSWLKAWTMNAAKRRARQKAITALARRLAVIVHRMWVDEIVFRWTKKPFRLPPSGKLDHHAIKKGSFQFSVSAARRKDVLRGTTDKASSFGLLCRLRLALSGRESDWPPHSLIPSRESPAAHPEEKRGPARNNTPASGAEAEKRLTSTGRIEKSPKRPRAGGVGWGCLARGATQSASEAMMRCMGLVGNRAFPCAAQ